jgi:hypothetical protein
VAEFCRPDSFGPMTKQMLRDIEVLDKSLNDYLDKKRKEFGRLYFTSNEELVALIANLGNQVYL